LAYNKPFNENASKQHWLGLAKYTRPLTERYVFGDYVRLLLALFCLFFVSSSVLANPLSEKDVKAFFDKVDYSFINQSELTLKSTLSDDVIILGTMSGLGSVSESKVNKTEFVNSVVEGWNNYSNYHYKRKQLEIRKIDEEQAEISEVVIETFTLDNMNFKIESSNQVFIKRIQGEIKATKIIANSIVKST
jgi:hypothetical protein